MLNRSRPQRWRHTLAGAIPLSLLIVSTCLLVNSPNPALADPQLSFADVEDIVDHIGANVFPATYGGLISDEANNSIDIFLTTLDPETERAFRDRSADVTLTFSPTPNPILGLRAVQSRMTNDWLAARQAATDLLTFPIEIADGKIKAVLPIEDAPEAPIILQEYGASMVEIQLVSLTDYIATHQTTTTRVNDTAPYNAGDAISDGSAGCTSGFGVQVGSVLHLLTAGHCFVVGRTVRNYHCDDSECASETGSGRLMGEVKQRILVDQGANGHGGELFTGVDSEIFSGCDAGGTCGGDKLTFTGGLGSPQLATVTGTSTWHVGDQVCQSGAYSGEICRLTIQDDDSPATIYTCLQIPGCYTYDTLKLVHITTAGSKTGNDAVAGGDSGGPVFRFDGNDLGAVGTVTGGGGSSLLFTGINAALNSYQNVRLITG